MAEESKGGSVVNARDKATEDLFNQGLGNSRRARDLEEEYLGDEQQHNEELFKQNLQGRIDEQQEDLTASSEQDYSPEFSSTGFSFTDVNSFSQLPDGGTIPAGTELATLELPVSGGDFSFSLDSTQFALEGNRLSTLVDLTPVRGQQLGIDIRVNSNNSDFTAQIPVEINFDNLAEALQNEQAFIDNAPSDINLSDSDVAEGAVAGDFVATILGTDDQGADQLSFSLTGEGANIFEVSGNTLVVGPGVTLDFETRSEYPVEITVTDASGNTFTKTVTVNLTDVNEAPVLQAAEVTVAEDQGIINASLVAEDQDAGDQLTFTAVDPEQLPVGFTLQANGDYSFDATSGAYDHLGVGDSQQLTIPVRVTDSGGLQDTAFIKITISGTNDTPVAGADIVSSLDEGATAISGQLTATDADDGAVITFAVSDGASLPSGFSLDSEGNYSFDPADDAYQRLGAGDSQVITVPVTVTDEHGATDSQQIRITVNGTNDAPVAGADISASVQEGDAVISGQLSATDVDDGSILTFAVSPGADTPAGFTLDADGNYSFEPDAGAYQHLAVGDSQILTIPVTVTDELGATDVQQIQIIVTGTNDAPVAGADVYSTVLEGDSVISGQLSATDVDDSASLIFSVTNGASIPAGFTLNDDGSYSFNPQDAAYESLDAGDVQTLTIPVTVTDENGATDTQQIQITVNGTNDAPVAGADVTASVNEGDSAISGQLSATDADDSASLSFSVTNGASVPAGFTLNADGSYSFNPQDAAYDNLDAGDVQTLTIPVTVTDENGATDTQQIQITVNGTNDAPVAGADVTASVNEGGSAISGQLSATDADDSASLTFSVTNGASVPAGFTLNTDGSYSFDPQDAAYDSLDAGDVQTLTIPVTVTDENGATDTQQIQITVNGTNDAPVAGADVTANVNEGDSAISGQLSATDADDSASLSFSVTNGASVPAGFTLNADGSYSFDPQDAAYDGLDAGDVQTLTIPVTVTDENGATDTQQIQITVNGTNDAPVAGADVSASVDEGDSAISGQLSATDADDSASLSFSVTNGASVPAGFTLNSDGSYSFNPQDAAYNNLGAGDVQTLTIPVTVTDEHGATDTQQIQITVNGTNDAPVAGVDVTASVNEGDSSISGQLSATDADDSASLIFSVTNGASVPAGFILNADGSYSFNPQDAAYESLDAGDVQTLTIPVTVTDENGATDTQQIQITVNGTNDAPVAGADVTANVNEGDSAISGQLSATDADDSASLTFSVTSGASVPAGFTLNSNGSYSFNPQDAAYDSLDVGDVQTLTIPVTVTDENGATDTQQIQITVNGTNDAPVAGADVTASVNEGDSAISGQLSATDADDSASLSFSVTNGASVPAGFTLNADGSYSFNPQDAAYDSLDAGDVQTLTIPVTVTDENGATDTQQIQITVNGTNDAPVAGADVTASVNEGDSAISGQLSATDVDGSASLSFSVTNGASIPAGFTLNADGSYSFNPQDAAYDSLDAGDVQTLTIPVTVTDENGATDTQQIQITVNGTNDAPVAGADVTASVNEGDSAISGQLSATDADDSASLTFSVTNGASIPAGFTLNSDGSYSFNPQDAAYNNLDAGDVQTLTIPVTVTDENGATDTQQIQITVNGTNDAPVAGADVTASVNEGDSAISGQLSATDVDDSASLSFSVTNGASVPAGFTLNADGSYSFDPQDAAYDSLDAGDVQTLTIPVTVTDENGATDTQQIQITVNGTNDAPVASADVTASVNEGDSAISGQLSATDVDDSASLNFSVTNGASTPAGFTLNDDGSYSFDPHDAAYDGLDVGDVQTLTIPVTVTDENGATDTQQIQITVNGTNDAPVAGADVTATVNEGDSAINGQLSATDADDSANLSFSVTNGASVPAGFTLNADGSYSFDPQDAAYDSLDAGDVQTLTIPVTVTDENGATDTQQIQITVNGTNDAPVAGADVTANVNEGDSAISGQLSATDADDSSSLTFSVTNGASVPAGFTLNADGSYSFNPQDAAYDGLDAGDVQTLSIPVTVTDENGATDTQQIQITVNGTNDAPVAGADVTASVNEGDSAISGQLSATDADDSASLIFSVTNGASIPAGFTLNDDGSYSFDPQDVAYDGLDAGDVQTLTIPVTVTDENGATDTQQIQITVNGTNDAPVAGADVTANVNEGDSAISGQLSATDADDSSSLTFSVTNGASVPAGFTLNADGSYSFNPQDAAYDNLDAGDVQTLTIPVTVTDENGATDTQQIQITVNGTNDAPVAGADVTATVNEGDSAISGQLSATDADDYASLSFSVTNGATVPAGFTLNADGSYSFDPQDAAYDSLDVGDVQTLTIPVTVTDENGATDTQQIQITVNGTNDAPVAGADVTANVNEGDSAISGQLSATDADDSSSLTFSITNGASVPAGFTLNDDGSYSFDPQDAAYDNLDAGDVQTLTIPVTVTDENGATDTQQIQITVNGTNDAPVAGADVTASVNEGDSAISGQLSATDADDSASLSFSVTNGASVPAGFTLNADGSYSFNPQDAAYDSLDAGDVQTLTIPVTVSDEKGATDTQQIQITVNGTNDAPVAGADVTASVNEGDSAISGQLSATDADDSASLTFSVTNGASVPAGFTLNTDGSYSFNPQDAAYDSLDAGDVQTLTVPVTVTDENGATDTQQIQITVNGTNDAPVAGADVTASVNEGDSEISGQLTATDADDSANLSFSVSNGASVPAGFTLSSDGSYSFDPQNAAYDGLSAGEVQTLAIPVTVTDQEGATDTQLINITVNGTNDAPVANTETISGLEDKAVVFTASDLLGNDSDVDGGTLSIDSFQQPDNGSLAFDAITNTFTFTPDENWSGNTDFQYTVADGQGGLTNASSTIAVAGVADEPNLSVQVGEAVDGTVERTISFDNSSNDYNPEKDGFQFKNMYAHNDQGLASTGYSGTVPPEFQESDGNTFALKTLVISSNGNPHADTNRNSESKEVTFKAYDEDGNVVGTHTVTTIAQDNATTVVNFTGVPGFDDVFRVAMEFDGSGDRYINIDDVVVDVHEGNSIPLNISSSLGVDTDGSESLSGVVLSGVPADATLSAGTKNADGDWVVPQSDLDGLSVKVSSETTRFTLEASVTSTESDSGDTSVKTVTVPVNNSAPVAAEHTGSAVEDGGEVSGTLAATDADNDSLSYSLAEGGQPDEGSVTINDDGTYSFDPGSDFQDLGAGQTREVSFSYQVSDGYGGSVTGIAKVIVTGTNDGPVAGQDVSFNLFEGAAPATGQLSATDIDNGSVLSFSVSDGATAPAGFTLNADGSFIFNPQHATYDGLDQGDVQILTIPVTVTDDQGATDTQQIRVTVTGQNDAPVAGADVVSTVDEGAASVTGQLSATDADSSSDLTYSVTGGATVPAGFTLNADGSYSFNPQDAAYDGLDAGDAQTLTIPVTVTDDQGATDTQQIQITVNGTNDAPVAGVDVNASVNEGDSAIVGQLSATDADDSASLSFSVTNGASVPAGFTLNADGSYSFNPQDAAYDGLDAGDVQTLTIPVTVTDENGATDTQQIQITVNGTNDAPVAGADVTASVNEGDSAISGQLSATDADDSASLTFSVTSGASIPAGFTLNSDGSYSFNPQDVAYDNLDAGDVQTLTIPVTVTDENGATDTQQIQITVNGTNDAPVAGADVTASVNEGDSAISGQLSATDADDSASLSFSVTNGASVPAGFTLNADGSYSFNPEDAAYDGLAAGDVQTLTIPVTVTDENGATDTQQIQITVNGTNDTPVAGADVTASVNEGDSAISGQLSASDADDSASLSFSVTNGASVPAGFTLNADGSYSFNPQDAAYDSLDAGDVQTLTIPVTVTDENGATDTQQIQITVNGTNDAPVAGADVTASVNEGDSAISGQLSATDADDSASLSFSVTNGASVPAGFTLNADGSYSFNPEDAAYDGLAAGDVQTLTIPVTVTDENGATDTQQIQITVNGTNDAPVAGADVTASVNEGDSAISGQLSATDADDSASLTFGVTNGASVPAGFTLNSDGSYSFNPQDAAYENLDAGDVQTLTIPVTVTDENGATDTQQIQITVNGTNDAPVAGADVTASVNEGDSAISGQLSATDVDDSASLTFSTTVNIAGFTLNTDGSYSFDPQDSAYEQMDVGDVLTLGIPVTVTDEHGATDTQRIEIRISGTNDAPVADADVAATVNEGDSVISGQLSASDADYSASLSFSVTNGASVPAGFTLNTDGSYSFNPQDAAYENLDVGDVQTLTIPVTVTDEHGATDTQQIQITVNGTNDAPVAGVDVTANVNEGDSAISGQLSATDVDDSASLTFNTTVNIAGFTLNTDGSYSFDPQDSAYEQMDVGDVLTLGIPVTVTDEHGATDTQRIEIRISGTNDAPVADADVAATVNEGDSVISGQLSASDADYSASLSFSVTNGASVPAGFTLNTDGSYSFNPQDAAYDSLDAGDVQTLTIPVTVTDEHGATDTQQIQITVNGTNDTPVAGVDVTANVSEGDSAISGQLSASDVDDSASLTFSVTTGASVPAGFTLNADGSYSFNPQDTAYNGLDAGDVQTLTIPVTVTDEHGATDTQQIQITVNGTNDAPVAGADISRNVAEDAPQLTGSFSATDADDSASLSYSLAGSAPAGFNLSADGTYTFDPSDDAYQHLAVGNTQTLTIPVTVTDESGATDTQQLQIVLSGTNDAPVMSVVQPVSVDVPQATVETTTTLFSTTFDNVQSGSGADSFVQTADGWGTDSEGIEIWSSTSGHTGDGKFIELNDDKIDNFDDAEQISRTVDTVEGATYTLDFDFAGRAGFGANVNNMQVKVNGQVIDTFTDDGTGQSDQSWNDGQITFTGTGQPMTIEFVSIGEAQNYGRGMRLDNIELTQTVMETPDATITGQLQATDIDDNSNVTFAVQEGTAAPAGFTLNADGSYSFNPDNAAYENIPDGTSQVLTIPVVASDGQGGTAVQNLQITVNGTSEGAPAASVVANDDNFAEINAAVVKTGSNISNLGNMGQGSVNGVAESDTETRTFDFGAENAGKTVTLSFDSRATGGWEDGTSGSETRDTFTVRVNGQQIDQRSYDEHDDADNTWNATHSYQVTLDSNGQAVVEFDVASTASDEVVSISNLQMEKAAAYATDEDTAVTLNVLGNDTGSSGNNLSISSFDNQVSMNGMIVGTVEKVVVGGIDQLKFTPNDNLDSLNAGESATLSFNYTLTGAQGGSDTATVTFKVQGTDDAYVFDTSNVGNENTDTSGLNRIDGTGSKDNIKGTDNDDYILGVNGDDKLEGKDGNDVLDGGDGKDDLKGGDGQDTLYGRDGDDKLKGEDGNDYLDGGDGNDDLKGGDGNDQILGGEGNDDLKGEKGDDLLLGGAGNDDIKGGDGNDVLSGGKGDDTVKGEAGNDTYVYNPFDGNDTFSGGNGGGWTDIIQLTQDGTNDPENPWTITVDGQEVEYDLAAQALELNPDTSGVVTMADGSELTFEGVEKIEW